MGLLQVDVAGVNALAARCQLLASDVGGVSVAPFRVPQHAQATAVAVHAVRASVTAASAAMTARLETTATKLAAAGAAFAAQESRTADSLAALTAPPAV